MTASTFCFIICILAFLRVENHVFGWEVDKYPNPNKDINSCGRRGVKSWICDPDEVLKKGEADKLEEWLESIHQETDSDCGGSSNEKGYEIAVALLKSMYLLEGETSADGAERFAKTLQDAWGVGKKTCNDGALVFLSVGDRQVYISTGRKTKEKLTNEQIVLIIEKLRPFLREKQYGKALEHCLELSKSVLEGKPLVSTWNFGSVVSLIFCGVFVLSIVAIIYNYYNNKKLMEFERKLTRIDEERKNPKEYKALVCPVCLEDFTPQTKVKLLLCGHKYCESCLSEWLKTNTSCPICRQNVNREEEGTTTRDEQHDSSMELRYRLSSLHHQYPHFVSQDIISHWLSPDFHGTFFEDMNQRRSVVMPSFTGSHGSGVSFGGGTSRGGGGSGGSW